MVTHLLRHILQVQYAGYAFLCILHEETENGRREALAPNGFLFVNDARTFGESFTLEREVGGEFWI